MSDIETLIFSRKREVQDLIEKRRAELSILEDELVRIDAIISSQGLKMPVPVSEPAPPPAAKEKETRAPRDKTVPTIKEKILSVLADTPEGLRMKDLHAAVENKFDAKVLEKSIVPQVSRLRDDLKIFRTPDGLWCLAPVKPEPEAPSE